MEDAEHKFVENLFIPAKMAVMPKDKEEAEEGHFDSKPFDPATLPTWQGIANLKNANFEDETPHENFVLRTNTIAKGHFFIKLEVKSKDKDEVYEAEIDATKGEVFKLKSKENAIIKSGLIEVN